MPKKSKTKDKEKLPALLQSCQELFQTTDLYQVLGIRREATPQEVKKGYHKVSLSVHPDRVGSEGKEEATRKFQTLGKVYCILSDKDKRGAYDETGEVDEEGDVIDQDRDWCEYWRLLFPKVTVKDIQEFEKKYKALDQPPQLNIQPAASTSDEAEDVVRDDNGVGEGHGSTSPGSASMEQPRESEVVASIPDSPADRKALPSRKEKKLRAKRREERERAVDVYLGEKRKQSELQQKRLALQMGLLPEPELVKKKLKLEVDLLKLKMGREKMYLRKLQLEVQLLQSKMAADVTRRGLVRNGQNSVRVKAEPTD